MPITSVNCEQSQHAISTYNTVKTPGRASLKVSSTSVDCERAISTYNTVKTSGRPSLKVASVECLVFLNLEASSVRDFPYEDAFQAWTLRKQRPGLHVIEKRAAPWTPESDNVVSLFSCVRYVIAHQCLLHLLLNR